MLAELAYWVGLARYSRAGPESRIEKEALAPAMLHKEAYKWCIESIEVLNEPGLFTKGWCWLRLVLAHWVGLAGLARYSRAGPESRIEKEALAPVQLHNEARGWCCERIELLNAPARVVH